ncbi:4Fe-4S dicluster domain-containing protein [Spirosoma sp. HMF4905]|uniref:4Fe-4S dicluster domain-containing protein n=1 Tax=Spirosoma arboris TaxID=2682092 RepID=A0A7K1S7G6_9BACT|nr:4Fe-4S dicluster domain-containing protein [Spirosoma arboris]MVM29548.1 4Fe-4S dicluster domain-containing protein [Spirosoma arboris]
MPYFKDIQSGIRTTLKGLSLTLRHLRNATHRRTPEGIASDNYFDLQNGLVTLQYPHEQLPIPDNGRYRLRNEIDDCIVCDKCAKVCPVDCITIDAIKATEEVGRASDGSPIRLYAAKFDIDMAKCCYCGLCTVVCPTECLTMDKKFDYSEFELGKLTYNFSNLSEEEANEKRSLYEQFLFEKEAAKAAQLAAKAASTTQTSNADDQPVTPKPSPARPVFRPTAKPVAKIEPVEPANSEDPAIEHPLTDATPQEMQQIAQGAIETTKHPVFKPTQKPIIHVTDVSADGLQAEKSVTSEKSIVPKPAFRPSMKPPVKEKELGEELSSSEPPKAKPAFRPTMKPAVSKPEESKEDLPALSEESAPKPAFRPTMKPTKLAEQSSEPDEVVKLEEAIVKPEEVASTSELPKAKPAFRPTMKPAVAKPEESDIPIAPEASLPKVTGFRPTMKPVKPVEGPVSESSESTTPVVPAAKPPAFRPTMKPTAPTPKADELASDTDSPVASTGEIIKKDDEPIAEPAKPKPAFRPTMKPKPKPDDGESA